MTIYPAISELFVLPWWREKKLLEMTRIVKMMFWWKERTMVLLLRQCHPHVLHWDREGGEPPTGDVDDNTRINYDNDNGWQWLDLYTMLIYFWIQMRKENDYIFISKCFPVSFLLVNGKRNWGQLNKWGVLHFPSNIVQITCHCYNEKEHTILPNVTWLAQAQSYGDAQICQVFVPFSMAQC